VWEDTEKETTTQILAQLRWYQCLSKGLGNCWNWRWSATPRVMDTSGQWGALPSAGEPGSSLSPFTVVSSQRSWCWRLAPHSHPVISPGWASVVNLSPACEGLWAGQWSGVESFWARWSLRWCTRPLTWGTGVYCAHSTLWVLCLPLPHFALD